MKKLLFSLLVLLSSFAVMAQEDNNTDTTQKESAHYLVFDLGGGLHFLTYDMDDWGSKKPGFGFMGRAGYRFFFNKHWGIGTEINFKTYSTTATLSSLQELEGAVDEDGESYLHRTYFNDLKEKQKQTAFNIPLGVYYQTQLSEKWKAVAGLGMFYQLQELSNKFETSDGSLETRGYYKNYNVELYGMDQHNFYTADGFEGDNTKKSCLGLFAEGNLLYQLTNKLELDLGVYFSYGLNYQSESEGKLVYDPDCKAANAYKNANYNGVLESSIVDNSHNLALGIMAGIRYRLGKDAGNKNKPGEGDDDDLTKKNLSDGDGSDSDSTQVAENDPNIDNDGNGDGNAGKTGIGNDDNNGGNTNIADNGDDANKTGKDGNDGNDSNVGKQDRDKRTPGEILVDELKKFNKVAVNFAFNDSHVNASKIQKEMFDHVAFFMNENPNLTLHIVGHTCNIGTLQQNKIVGQRRADAVKQEMLNRGVPAQRITTESKAYLEPLVPNTSEENRAKNRRIEFSITDDTNK